ncbi:MAG: hypothetical protein ACK559_16895, partial [bacterium]
FMRGPSLGWRLMLPRPPRAGKYPGRGDPVVTPGFWLSRDAGAAAYPAGPEERHRCKRPSATSRRAAARWKASSSIPTAAARTRRC